MIGRTLSHYRIVDRIGTGGMGVVYLAHDEQLDRDVAIKVLAPGSITDETARKRFRTEALSLGRLNHPNIATVHEFGSQDGVDFLVTEYVAGTTLDAKIAQGPLSSEEVSRLGVQLAEGLRAAHLQGIVHRDLKPENLRLTTDGRLKILDFGIAQFVPRPGGGDRTVTLNKIQELAGTVPYMAPEQLRGEMVDSRSDIWSAGAVLYEMATGQRPFAGDNAPVLINAIQNSAPAPPMEINRTVSPGLQRVLLRALEKDPERRYQAASDLGTDLERLVTTSSAVRAPQTRRRSLRWTFVLAGVAALVLVALGGYLFHRNKHREPVSSKANRRPTIAVLGFQNLSGKPEDAWLSTALSEMLTTELSQGGQLRTIPGETVAKMKLSLSLPDADSFSRETLKRIRQNLGSDNVVLGSYLPLGNGQLRLDLRLQDAVAGETLISISEKGEQSEIDEVVSKVGAELRSKLGVSALSDGQSAVVKASLPANREAARLYSEGLQKLRLFDALAASDSLAKAAALDPSYAPIYSALAGALSTLGYDSKAKEEAKRGLALSGPFSQEQRLLIAGSAHEILAEPSQAIESYRALWELVPDNIDYGLSLIRAQIAGGHANDAEKTLFDLRKLQVSEADAARITLAEAMIAESLSDFKRQQMLAEHAANLARPIGGNLLVAEALQLEANSFERMGQTQKAVELSNQARELFVSAGDRRGAARTLLSVGDVLYDKGDYEGAKEKFEDALRVFRELGAQKSIRATLERIGNVYYSEGQPKESLKFYGQALRFDQEIKDLNGLASDYGNLANAYEQVGDLQGALQMQQESLSAFNDVGDRRGAAATLNNLGDLLVEMGNPGEAKQYFERSISLHREIAHRHGEPYPITGLGDALFAQGDLAGARKQYEQALALCKETNDENLTAQLNVSLAQIALAEKRYSDGEVLARQGAAGYEKANSTDDQARALAVLARNLLGAGKLKEAQSAAQKAVTLSQHVTGLPPRYEVQIADALVKAQSGELPQARRELESVITSAGSLAYRSYQYQARLALGEIELLSGSVSAPADLAALESDARAQGLLLVANQAHALSTGK